MTFSGRGGRRRGRGFGSSLRALFLVQVDNRGGKGLLFCEDGQAKRGQHKDGSDSDCEFAQEVGGASTAEDGLTRASELCTDLGAFP